MPADIINLRQARKQRARDDKEARATENRVRFGRTKAQRQQDERSNAQAEKALDGHLRTQTSDGPSPRTKPAADTPSSEPGGKSPR